VVPVRDDDLAACLFSAGFPLAERDRLSKSVGDLEIADWNFTTVGEFGGSIGALIEAWERRKHGDLTWFEKHPDHVFTHACGAIENRRHMARMKQGRTPDLYIARGSSVAILGPELAKHKEEYLLRKIGV
jgi:hypothetical protein